MQHFEILVQQKNDPSYGTTLKTPSKVTQRILAHIFLFNLTI